MNEFAERLARLLEERKMSQRQLAALSGATEATISRYVNGSRSPGAQTARDIAAVLDVSVEYLLGGEEPFVRDPEVMELLDELHRRPELRVLFSTSRGATAEDIRAAIETIERLKKGQGEGY